MQADFFDCPPTGENELFSVVAHADDSGQLAGFEHLDSIHGEDELTVRDRIGDAAYEAMAARMHDWNAPPVDVVTETRKGRKPIHASASARKAAYRAERARIDYTDAPHIVDKLKETAAQLDCSVNELLQSMVRFAETNRNWKQVGLYGARRHGALQ